MTHGYANVVARYLSENGLRAEVVPTRFVGESLEGEEAEQTPVEVAQSAADIGPARKKLDE